MLKIFLGISSKTDFIKNNSYHSLLKTSLCIHDVNYLSIFNGNVSKTTCNAVINCEGDLRKQQTSFVEVLTVYASKMIKIFRGNQSPDIRATQGKIL